MDDGSCVVLKIGGAVAEDGAITDMLFRELHGYTGRAVLVHGGGAALTRLSQRLGIEVTFSDGVRVTSSEEMELADMVLAGRVNTQLVRRAGVSGLKAAGLTGADGGLFLGKLVDPAALSRTASVEEVRPEMVHLLLSQGFLPIVASVGVDRTGDGVNINADEAAQSLAAALARDGHHVTLCYLSDINGVLNSGSSVIRDVPIAAVEDLVRNGTVRGGMTAKLRSAVAAIKMGLDNIVIGGYREPGDLQRLLAGDTGTTVH
ncbi:MAG: acetylglutamate kinase [Alkalispirochaeta sp.]|jgi:acetylglutamate kinase